MPAYTSSAAPCSCITQCSFNMFGDKKSTACCLSLTLSLSQSPSQMHALSCGCSSFMF